VESRGIVVEDSRVVWKAGMRTGEPVVEGLDGVDVSEVRGRRELAERVNMVGLVDVVRVVGVDAVEAILPGHCPAQRIP
jgi:hypothetical protein